MSKNNMPCVTNNNIRDRLGSALLEATYSNQIIFIPHSGNTDFGIDYTCELISENQTTGMFSCVQLKTHEKMDFDCYGNYTQQIKSQTANYWLVSNLPVVLVLVDLSRYKIYSIDAQKYIRHNIGIEKLKSQENVSFVVNINDNNLFQSCVQASYEYDKYKLLLKSCSDCLLIRDFLIYINDYTGRDWCMNVEPNKDYTKEILSLAHKYYNAFSNNSTFIKLYRQMKADIEKCYNEDTSIIEYDDYDEQLRSRFNQTAADFLMNLVELICDEIQKDKIGRLANQGQNFMKLQNIIKKIGRPILNDKWDSVVIDNFFNE